MIVLLQTGKGADMGAAFGAGASQTLFGSTGAATFLTKATTMVAIAFMITSLGLAYLSSHRTGSSVVLDQEPAPIERQADPAPAETSDQPATEAESAQPANQAE